MSRIKYFLAVMIAAFAAGVFFLACSSDEKEKPEDEGKKAGEAMCACVSSYVAPTMPILPTSPLPPAGISMQEILALDLTNPEVLAGLDPDVMNYLMDPAIMAYLIALGKFQSDFEAYAGELYQCLGTLAPYQKYVEANPNAYNPAAAEPLYSIFTFKDADFEKGFKSGTASCMQTFTSLFALIGQQ